VDTRAFTLERAMDTADHCRAQWEECRRLEALAKNEAEATLLRNLGRTWKMIEGQIARYEEVLKNQK
jgi:hypothetical protein